MEGIRPEIERRKSAQESLDVTIDIPTGFSKDAKHQAAERVLEQTRNGVDRWLLEKPLYLYLTQKVSDAELRIIEGAFNKIGGKEQYLENQRKTAHDAEAQALTVSYNIAWFGLYRENPSAQKPEKMARTIGGKNESVEISYKEYFTVPIEEKDARLALVNIERFQNVLPALAKELADLGQSENDQIQMKVPGNLQSFIKHPDSLVIHYRNPALSEKIRQVVEGVLGGARLKTYREGRAHSGFDFEGENELYSGSHSSLIASIVADKVIDAVRKNPELSKASAEEFILFLDKAFEEYSTLSPKEILSRLDTIKN